MQQTSHIEQAARRRERRMASANRSLRRGIDHTTVDRAHSQGVTLMTFTNRARTAFAVLALSASLLGSVLPAAALAAQVDPTHPTPNGPQMPPPQVPPIATPVLTTSRRDQKPPLPDVSVVTVGHSGSNVSPDHLDVAFNLKTTGSDANIMLKAECNYRYLNDPSLIVTEQKPLQGMSLSANWAPPIPFLVTCAPSYGQFVSSVFLTAEVPGGDSNLSNNTGSWDHITNK
jgi:hypothetical protein